MVVYTDYSFSDILHWLRQENVALMVCLPEHLGLIFAAGHARSGKKLRHVLLSRPSGGQSPCGWVPFTLKDRAPDELLWEDENLCEPDPDALQKGVADGTITPEQLREKVLHTEGGVTMEYSPGHKRRIYVVTRVSFYWLVCRYFQHTNFSFRLLIQMHSMKFLLFMKMF